jgi:hypothetical protein
MPSGHVHECDLLTRSPGHGKQAALTVPAPVMTPEGQSSHSLPAGSNTNCPGNVVFFCVYRRNVPSGLPRCTCKQGGVHGTT